MPLLPIALFDDIGFQELLLIAFAAVVIFGRRLPEVAARGYAQFQRVRRTLTDMWRETGIEDEIRRLQRDVKRAMPKDVDLTHTVRREIARVTQRDDGAHGTPPPAAAPSVDAKQGQPTDSAQESARAPTSNGSDLRREDEVQSRTPEP